MPFLILRWAILFMKSFDELDDNIAESNWLEAESIDIPDFKDINSR